MVIRVPLVISKEIQDFFGGGDISILEMLIALIKIVLMCCNVKKDVYELYTKILFHHWNTNRV